MRAPGEAIGSLAASISSERMVVWFKSTRSQSCTCIGVQSGDGKAGSLRTLSSSAFALRTPVDDIGVRASRRFPATRQGSKRPRLLNNA